MGNSTVYDVQIRYGLEDKASAQLENLGRTAERTERHVGSVKEGLRSLAEVFLVKEGLHKAKEWFIDSNSEMEQMKINMAAITSYNLGTPFEKAAKQTDTLIAGWQQFSKSTTLTTKQFVEFGASIEGAVFNAGGGMKQLDDIVKRGAVVSNIIAKGHAGGLSYASTELREALSGNLRKTQMLNMQLLGPVMEKEGKSLEQWNTLTTSERMRLYTKAISDPAWNAAIDKQRDSFDGVTSTLKDNFEILARETGEKVFDKMKVSLKEMNQWIDTHPKEIADFTTKVADGLSKAFDLMKGAFEFVVAHKDILIKLGEIWAMGKVTGALGGMGGFMSAGSNSGQGMIGGMAAFRQNSRDLTSPGLGGAQMNAMYNNGAATAGNVLTGALVGYGLDQLTGDLGKTNTALMGFEGAISGLPGPLGLVGQGLLALHSSLKWFAEQYDKNQKVEVEHEGDFLALKDQIKRGDAGALYASLKQAGIVKNGEFSPNAFVAYTNMKRHGAGIVGPDFFGGDSKEDSELAGRAAALVANMKDRAARDNYYNAYKAPSDVEKGKKKDKANINVTIQKIEVPASDPDRFVHSLVKKFDKLAKNPTQAERTLRGGF